jgi:hypothetical protein
MHPNKIYTWVEAKNVGKLVVGDTPNAMDDVGTFLTFLMLLPKEQKGANVPKKKNAKNFK